MGSSKMKAQCQTQGHVTYNYSFVFLKKKSNKCVTKQHGLLDLVHRCVYISQCIHSKLYLLYANSHRKKNFRKFSMTLYFFNSLQLFF